MNDELDQLEEALRKIQEAIKNAFILGLIAGSLLTSVVIYAIQHK